MCINVIILYDLKWNSLVSLLSFVRERSLVIGVTVYNLVIFSFDKVQASIVAKGTPLHINDNLYFKVHH